MLATKVFHPDRTTIKTFKQTKAQLVDMLTPHVKFIENEDPSAWECVHRPTGTRYGPGILAFDLPAGEYYIGDLCYDMLDDAYDNIWGNKFCYSSGLYHRQKGDEHVYFGMLQTDFGDGRMEDAESGREYTIDAGHIGIASASICKRSMPEYLVKFTDTVHVTFDGGTRYSFWSGSGSDPEIIIKESENHDDYSDNDYY